MLDTDFGLTEYEDEELGYGAAELKLEFEREMSWEDLVN